MIDMLQEEIRKNTSTERQQIIAALYKFVRRRPGMDPRDYDYAGYNSERRQVHRDLQRAERLIRAVEIRQSIGVEQLKAAFKRAFSGRLSYWPAGEIINHGGSHTSSSPYPRLDYCTGQYFPTEYRKAVCAVMASALWDYWRDGYQKPPPEVSAGLSVGAKIRKSARQEFGLEIAKRYFDYRAGDYR